MEKEKKILVVDDEKANLFMLEGILSNEGFEVFTSENGIECLEFLRSKTKPDIILLDIMMPELNGIETLRKIINHNAFKDIPVIMVSALTDGDHIEAALSIGATEYIKKPIDELELLARIATVLKIKKQEQMLKENLRIKDDFIRMISHDLRTPFSTISGFAHMLLEDAGLKLNEEQKDILNFIYGSSDFVIEYFNKMLAWSNIGQRELILEKEPADLKSIVNTAALTFKPKLNEKNIMLRNKIPYFELELDVAYFTNAFNNLISNAIKFTGAGGDISLFMTVEKDKHIINIKDNGMGIIHEKKVLFTSKLIKSSAGTQGEKGTGTGLYICKKIMDAHGFDLDFETEIGKGTTFKIIL